jgi:TRAP transporter TAXI family solute receptor
MTSVRWLSSVLSLLGATPLLCGCETRPVATQGQTVLRFASSGYGDQLAHEYERLLPNVRFELVHNPQPDATQAILRGELDLAIQLADAAYGEDVKDAQERIHRRRALRAISVLEVAPLHLLVRPQSGVNALSDLRGRRVGTILGDFLTDWVLKAFGLDDAITRIGPFTRSQLSNALAQGSLETVFDVNKLDALFIVNMYPASLVEDLIRAGARLVPIEGRTLADVSAEYPFVQWMSLPAHVYPGQTERLRTIAIPALLVCRSDLDEEMVYSLTAHLLDAVSQAPLYKSVLRHIAVQDASATPIPLHDGAARYYREYEVLQ